MCSTDEGENNLALQFDDVFDNANEFRLKGILNIYVGISVGPRHGDVVQFNYFYLVNLLKRTLYFITVQCRLPDTVFSHDFSPPC